MAFPREAALGGRAELVGKPQPRLFRLCLRAWLNEQLIPSCVLHFNPVLGINLPAAVLAVPCPGLSPSPGQGSQWDPELLSAFPMGLRAELGRWRTSPAWVHTAVSCKEHGCSMALPDWQRMRNVITGTQVGPGLPAAAPSQSQLCPAWLCLKKLVELQCPCPICPAVLAAQWCGSPGQNYEGEYAECFLSFLHEHQQLGMWDARLWGTLGFALLLPLLPEWEMEAV